MRRAGGGRIVNVSDWLPVSGRPRDTGHTPYYASKAAVKALTESLALELAPRRPGERRRATYSLAFSGVPKNISSTLSFPITRTSSCIVLYIRMIMTRMISIPKKCGHTISASNLS